MKNFSTALCAIIFLTGSLAAQDKTACLAFNGSSDKVLVPHHSSLNLGRSPFTIEVWIAASANMVANNVLAPVILSKKGATSPSTDGFLFGLTDAGKVALQLEGVSFTPGFSGGGSGGVTALDLRDNQCHHMAWTREVYGGSIPDTVNAYQDAAFVRKSRLGAQQLDVSNSQDVWIGGSDFNTNPNLYWFEGQIKEVRIWSFAKTESQIFADKNEHLDGTESGLLFYWRLNENDCGPNGRHGIIDGAQWATFICDNMTALPPNTCTPDTSSGTPGLIAENSQSQFSLYPNPVTDELNIVTTSSVLSGQVTISDLAGRIIVTRPWINGEKLNVSDLHQGIYYLQIVNGNNVLHHSMLTKK